MDFTLSEFSKILVDSRFNQDYIKTKLELKRYRDITSILDALKSRSKSNQIHLTKSKDLDFECYVDPSCMKNESFSLYPDLKSEFSVKAELDHFLNSGKKILLIVGLAGSGKTFCLNKLEEQLINEGKIPIKISLGAIDEVSVGLIEDFINRLNVVEKLQKIDFKMLRKDHKNNLIFMLDAYDEAHCERIKDCLLFNSSLKTDKWLKCKFLITCRQTASIFNTSEYWSYFSPRQESLSEVRLLPFNSEKRIELFSKLSAKYLSSMKVQSVEEIIKGNQILSGMKHTPFNLKVIFRTIPGLITKKAKLDELTMMEEYIQIYFERGIKKLLDEGKPNLDYEEKVNIYCKQITRLMIKNNCSTLKYSSDRNSPYYTKLLDLSVLKYKILFDMSPLQIVDSHTYEFMTIEIFEFFKSKVDDDETEIEHQSHKNENEKIVRNIMIDYDDSSINKYRILTLARDKLKQEQLFKNLSREKDKNRIIKTLKLLIGIEMSKTNIGDQINIELKAGDQVSVSNFGENIVEALVNGSIVIHRGEDSFIIKDANNDITRTLISSESKRFILNYTDKGFINLFIINNFKCENEIKIAKNVSYLISAKFSENDERLFICYQEKAISQVIVFDLVRFTECTIHSKEVNKAEYSILPKSSEYDNLEVQDILISPEGDYMIILKEYFSFELYYKNESIRRKVFGDHNESLSQKLLDKIKFVAKYNTNITKQQKVLEKTEKLSDEFCIQDPYNKENFEVYVNIQAVCEQLMSNYLSSSKISSFLGCIHTDMPATPLCTDILKDTTRSAISIEKRENVKYVLAVGTRAKIINSILNDRKAVFYCVYPRAGYLNRNEAQQTIYKNNIEKFKNLNDFPIENKQNSKIEEEMHGATYFFKDMNEKHYCFSLKGRQANQDDQNCSWGIWFGEISNPVIKYRCERLAEFYNQKGFTIFKDYLVENNLI